MGAVPPTEDKTCEYATPAVPAGNVFGVCPPISTTTVSVNACGVAAEDGGPALTASMVKLYGPAGSVTELEVSAPVAGFSVMLGGSAPAVTEKVSAPPVPPPVRICAEYELGGAVPGKPFTVTASGNVVVVIVSGPFTCTVYVAVAVCGGMLLSVTVSEKLYVPGVVGVPAKAPVCDPGAG